MKTVYQLDSPGKVLKAVHTLVVFPPFCETLAGELYQAWLEKFPGAAVKSLEDKTRLGDILGKTGAGSLFGEAEVLKVWRLVEGGKFATKDSLAALKRVLELPADTTPIFIAIEHNGTKPAWLKNLVETFQKGSQSQAVEIPKLYEKDARTLAARFCRQVKLNPSPGALGEMVKMTEGLADRMNNEVKKLALYIEDPKGNVTEKDVQAVFDPAAEENTFSLTDDLASGDRTRLLLRLKEFSNQASQFPKELLLGSFHHLIDDLLEVQAARETVLQGVRGYSQVQSTVQARKAELSPKLRGIHPFRINKLIDLVSRLTTTQLINSALELHHVDRVIKGAAHSAADPYDLLGEWLVGLLPQQKSYR